MCELLAISARFPTTIQLSLDELAMHGGATGPHRTCSIGCDGVPLIGVSVTHDEEQQVALVASVPLSGERWEALAEGELLVIREGRVILREPPMAA